jgi:hypothetical protein
MTMQVESANVRRRGGKVRALQWVARKVRKRLDRSHPASQDQFGDFLRPHLRSTH